MTYTDRICQCKELLTLYTALKKNYKLQNQMLLYHIPFLRKFLGGKWGKVTGLFFGHRWIHLSPDALEFTEYWSHGKLVPKLHCLDCYWSGLIDRAANGIWELQLGEPYYVRTFADGSVSKPGDPAKVCPVCGSPLYTYCEP